MKYLYTVKLHFQSHSNGLTSTHPLIHHSFQPIYNLNQLSKHALNGELQ